MPLHLSVLEKIGLFYLNEGPSPMVDLLGVLSFKAVTAALRLGLFEALGDDRKSAAELAGDINSESAGLSLLLGALENLGYVRRTKCLYRNTAATKKWLLRNSPDSIADMFHQFNDMSFRWEYLDESIRCGRPPMMGWEWLDNHPEKWHAYHAGLKNSAVLISRELFKKIKLPGTAGRILDLGGSHGQYCIEFCLRYPRLSGNVYDWAPAEKTALENIGSYGLADRISFTAGDFITDPIAFGYDVVLLFNVIRIFRPDELKSLLRKIHAVLSDNGMVIIMDHLGHTSPSRFMKANAFLILLEIYNSTEGKTHRAADVSSWLDETGFTSIRDHNLKRSPGLGVITAVKK